MNAEKDKTEGAQGPNGEIKANAFTKGIDFVVKTTSKSWDKVKKVVGKKLSKIVKDKDECPQLSTYHFYG